MSGAEFPTKAGTENGDWVNSREARRLLRVSTCELMHLREMGHLRSIKSGNAFLYRREDILRFRSRDL